MVSMTVHISTEAIYWVSHCDVLIILYTPLHIVYMCRCRMSHCTGSINGVYSCSCSSLMVNPLSYAATMIFPKSLGNVCRLEENTLNIYMKFGRKYYILYSYENWRKIYLIILMKIGGKVLYIYQDYAENLIEK